MSTSRDVLNQFKELYDDLLQHGPNTRWTWLDGVLYLR
jgi:hypothetical protein